MSKLTENPAKEVPKRVLMLGLILTVIIVALNFLLDFNLWWVIGFYWLAVCANLIAFRMIVIATNVMVNTSEEEKKKSIAPNLMMRYAIYLGVFFLAWFLDGFPSLIATFVGVQMVSLSIKLDIFISGGD